MNQSRSKLDRLPNTGCNHEPVCVLQNIVQSEAIIRGDLANVRVGRHCVISSRAVIRSVTAAGQLAAFMSNNIGINPLPPLPVSDPDQGGNER